MQEVTIRLQFTQPCLGAVRKQIRNGVIYAFIRSPPDNKVMFLPTWWRERMRYAAQVLQRCHTLVDKIDWGAFVDGPVSQWQRTLQSRGRGRKRYALHEAFRPGTVIGLTAVLPESLTIFDFIELLNMVGQYRGISHFTSADNVFGTFQVSSVMPTIKGRKQEQEG